MIHAHSSMRHARYDHSWVVRQRRSCGFSDATFHCYRNARHQLSLETLEQRVLLSTSPGWNDQSPAFADGEVVVGFEGDVVSIFNAEGADKALSLARDILSDFDVQFGKILYGLSAQPGRPARLATQWQFPVSVDVQLLTAQLAQLPGVAYAEPDYTLHLQSSPSDPGFTGTWEFGVQEHLSKVSAAQAWDVTVGDPSVVVAVIDSGADLDHPDLAANLVDGKSFVGDTVQDHNGHGTVITGLIAARMNNLQDLASEAHGDLSWAGGIVGVSPGARVMPVKVLDSLGLGSAGTIAAGIAYAVDPDGDPATDDGADIINLSLGGGGFSQAIADSIAYAYDRGVLVISAVTSIDAVASPSYPALNPYALGVAAVNNDDVWNGSSNTGSFVDLTAQGVNVLSTFVDVDDASEASASLKGGYGRESGSSLATAIVSGVAALVKSAHPNWGPDEIAGQLLATADSTDAANSNLIGQLGAGRVNAASAVGSVVRPKVVGVRGLGAADPGVPLLDLLEVGDTVEIRFSHAMDPASVLTPDHYQLTYLGNSDDSTDDLPVEVSVLTQPPAPTSAYFQDDENFYNAFPGRGITLRIDGVGGYRLPDGLYRLTVSSVKSMSGEMVQEYTHDFQISPRHVPFSGPWIVEDGSTVSMPNTSGITAADMNGDGYADILAAHDDQIAWYENINGSGTFGTQQVVTSREIEGHFLYARSVFAADFDGDGDLDILSDRGPAGGQLITWYENEDGRGRFGSRHVVGVPESPYEGRALAVDLDNDRDLDVLVGGSWYENLDGRGTFGTVHRLPIEIYRISPADLDDDGDQDLVAALPDESLVWLENATGDGDFTSVRWISTAVDATDVSTADLDGDEDLDIVAKSWFGPLIWFENMNGEGHFSERRLISSDVDDNSRFASADLDGDHDVDVFDGNAWYENTDGRGTFNAQPHALPDAAVSAADMDHDGDMDLVVYDGWLENTDGLGHFGPPQQIVRGIAVPYSAVDLDSDGDLDLLASSGGQVVWYPNTDAQGTFGPQQVIGGFGPSDTENGFMQAEDVDGDGDLDVVTAEFELSIGDGLFEGRIVWQENLDGQGTFGSPKTIWSNLGSGGLNVRNQGIAIFDVDGDGDRDVAWARTYYSGYELGWQENIDGHGNFVARPLIASGVGWVLRLNYADLDSDGDADLLAILKEWTSSSWKLVWYKNTDGAGNFGVPTTIRAIGPGDLHLGDMDSDGDQDIVAQAANESIAWYENRSKGTVFVEHRVGIENAPNGRLKLADLDDDGDIDILTRLASTDDPTRYPLGWYENSNGQGTFNAWETISTRTPRFHDNTFVAADLDGDHDLDVVATSMGDYSLVYYENLLPHPGDANRDGRFNSTDFIQVFLAGEYEDNIEDNSTWEEGDWNGDGDFDSGDFVLAFLTGLYEAKSALHANDIAAAVDWLFAQPQPRRKGTAFVS